MKPWVPSLSILFLSAALSAEQHTMPHSATPLALETGLGNAHYVVTTKSAEAQRYFDQGLRYVYAFHHEAAVRSFQRAGEIDPELAMAWWGVALALGPNINLDIDPEREIQAYNAVQAAQARAGLASPKERDLIAALARRYSNDPNADLKALAVDYNNAMAKLAKRYADDNDIATLYAESLMDLRPWKFWSRDGKPAEGTEEIVRVLESVLARDPRHVGANHYYIHAVEASRRPERARRSADRLRTLAPAAGHLVHMPAHIDQRTGAYGAAALANVAGAKADRDYIRKHGPQGIYPLMYYNHNLHFGSASYAMEGNFSEAKRLADEVGVNGAAIAKEMPMIEGITITPVLVLVRFGKWADVLRAPNPKAGPFSTTMWHFARGVAFAQLGNVAGAESERGSFREVASGLTDDLGMFQSSPRQLAAVASHVFDGRIAMARGDLAGAIASLRSAVALEDQLNYNEPADWFYPVRESLGAALLRDERYAEAEQAFRDDLANNPKNPRSLFGLAEALRRQKKDASKPRSEFRRSWKGSALRVEDL